MTRILFVCSENRLRSPTAAAIFAEYEDVETQSAGTHADCDTPVSKALLEWADVVLVMEDSHRNKILSAFPDESKGLKIGVLDIPDHFDYMAPILIDILRARVPRYVRIS